MKIYGLIGRTLDHSWSRDYFDQKFKREQLVHCTYVNFPIQNISDIHALVENQPGLVGLNVTTPYKSEVISHLDELHPDAYSIQAVNCIRVSGDPEKTTLTGFNTDHSAFAQTLKPLLRPEIKNALILGTGGASKAVSYALDRLNIQYKTVSRNFSVDVMTYADLSEEIIREHLLIINASTAGMSGRHQDLCPSLPYSGLTRNHILYDLVYNPLLTSFLLKGRENGCVIKNGLEMLQLQAELSWQIWNP